jgi:segregation and condensation protein A
MLFQKSEQQTYTLENFEGPLLFLLHLAQKNEIDICAVPLQRIVMQYLSGESAEEEDLDEGAEFVGAAASLLWLKSQTLLPLPQRDDLLLLPTEEESSPFAILPQLVEYLHFKQISKELGEMEERQRNFFVRGQTVNFEEIASPLQLEPVSLQKFAEVFQETLRRSRSQRGTIHEERWRVADKIAFIQQCLSETASISFKQLFSEESCREELIVTFLGLLELMKIGELVVCQNSDGDLYIQGKRS